VAELIAEGGVGKVTMSKAFRLRWPWLSRPRFAISSVFAKVVSP